MIKGAAISECGNYRFELFRVWAEALPIMGIVMLNPSTADVKKDDPTIKKCINIAMNNGFGSIFVYNLYPLRATNPKQLGTHPKPHDNRNYKIVTDGLAKCDEVVFAWGASKFAKDILFNPKHIYPNAKCLHINKDGSPKHPLYCKNETKLIRYNI